MKSKIRYQAICGLCLLVAAVVFCQQASAFWGRTWNGPGAVSCSGPACYPAFRPFGGFFHCAFCNVFPCRCHAWNACPPATPCYNPCFNPCGASYSYSDYCCDRGVLIDQPTVRSVPDRLTPGPNASFPNIQSPNVKPDTLNQGNFNQNPTLSPPPRPNPNAPHLQPMPNTSSYGTSPNPSTTFESSTNVTTPLERTPPSAVEEIISSDYDEIVDPASQVPAFPSESMPVFGEGMGTGLDGYRPEAPIPSPRGVTSPDMPPPPTRPGEGARKINLGTGVISVNVPENARVYINGYETKQAGTHRTYVSDDLIPGQDYRYEIHVVANVNGQRVEETKQMLLTADEHALLSFSAFDKVRPFPSMDLQLTARAE